MARTMYAAAPRVSQLPTSRSRVGGGCSAGVRAALRALVRCLREFAWRLLPGSGAGGVPLICFFLVDADH